MHRNEQIYKEHLDFKKAKIKDSITPLVEKYNLTKPTIKKIISQKGVVKKTQQERLAERRQKRWEKVYLPRFILIPKGREQGTIDMRMKLAQDMYADETVDFSINSIAKCMVYADHTTILSWFNKERKRARRIERQKEKEREEHEYKMQNDETYRKAFERMEERKKNREMGLRTLNKDY